MHMKCAVFMEINERKYYYYVVKMREKLFYFKETINAISDYILILSFGKDKGKLIQLVSRDTMQRKKGGD